MSDAPDGNPLGVGAAGHHTVPVNTPGDLRPPPIELLKLATGYQRARTLFSLVELRLPTMLAEGPLARDAIARRLGVEPTSCATRPA